MRTPKVSAILLAAVVAGCVGDAPTAAKATPQQAEATIGATDRPIAAIEAIVAALDAAWGAKDAEAYVTAFAEDLEFIGPAGGVFSGRAVLQAQLESFFSAVVGPTTESYTIRRVQFLTGTIVIVDLDSELTGVVPLPTGWIETAPGVVRLRERWVMVKRGGDWKIVALQLTPIPPVS